MRKRKHMVVYLLITLMIMASILSGCGAGDEVSVNTQGGSQIAEAPVETGQIDYQNHWAADDIQAVIDAGYVTLESGNSFYPDENITEGDFINWINAAAQYEVTESEGNETVTRAEASEILALYLRIAQDFTSEAAQYDDVESSDEYANAVGGLKHYSVFQGVESIHSDSFEPDKALTRAEAASMLNHATQAWLSVTVGSDVLIRDTQECVMDAPAEAGEEDILVDKSIVSLMGGAEVPEELQTVEPAENQIVVHFSQEQQPISVDAENRISLKELVEAYGGNVEFQNNGDEITEAAFTLNRALLKSNRNLNERELELEYAKFYLRYTETPLPERPDEIAWNQKKELYAVSAKKDDDTILNPETYSELLDPDFVPEEGWSTSSNGNFTTMCTIVDIDFPEGTEVDNADMISWWFAWHTLEDVRYMMWNPNCHYGVWVTTGNYDTRTEAEIAKQPMRLFDTSIGSWYERAYGSANRAHEDTTLKSTIGTAAYVDYDGTNSLEYEQLVINFVDLTDPDLKNRDGVSTPYFSSDEEYKDSGHSIAEEFKIQAGVTGESSTLTGVGVPMASMLHIMRKVDGEWKLITHFNSGPRSEEQEYVSEHQVREMAILASFLPEVYAMEKDKDLETYADPNCYVIPGQEE